MPLPNADTPWPPKHLAPVTNQLNAWSAWWTGDPEMLSAVYGGAVDYGRTGFFASEQGGFKERIRNTIQRWFWGTRPPTHEQRQKLHIGLAGSIASTSADLLFSEPPKITVADKGAQTRLDTLVDDGVHATLLEAADTCAGLGGAYLRVCWDKDARPEGPYLDYVPADAAIPEWTGYGMLAAVTFWTVIACHDDRVTRHLERHEKGVIFHGAYEGTSDNLGKPVPLDAYAATKGLDAVVDTGVDRLLVEYVPNMRPAKLWRNVPGAARLGRADVSECEPELDALDKVWSSWMNDLDLGRARLVVPDSYLQQLGRGKGARFDAEQSIYSALHIDPESKAEITQVQFAIRVADHRDTANALVAQILRDSGYSGQTFGEVTETGAVTATEVRSRERRSYTTRNRKIVYWRPALARLLETLLMVDQAIFKTPGVTPSLPALEFPDAISEDPGAIAQTVQLLTAADAVSTQIKVAMVHPDWDEAEVRGEVDRIRQEIRQQTATAAPDPQAALLAMHGAVPPGPEPAGAGQP